MFTRTEFHSLLEAKGTLILDGALATELEARGQNLNHPLWSGKILRDNPELIQKVHVDYFLAGADVAITASYQTSAAGLHEHFGLNGDEAIELMKRSVVLAQNARREAGREGTLLVAGSVGPYGAYLADGSEYRGDYVRSKEAFQDFHRARVRALVDAGVDLLAIETMPNLKEIEAVLEMLKLEFPGTLAWVSCTVSDAEHLSDGTPLRDVMGVVGRYENAVSFGVNCVPQHLVKPALEHLHSFDSTMPLVCYPNSGEVWDAETKTWSSGHAPGAGIGKQALQWKRAGAKLIGGCCKTGPKDIQAITNAL